LSLDLETVPAGLYHLEVITPGKAPVYSKLLVSKP